jgi:hypothetical protein
MKVQTVQPAFDTPQFNRRGASVQAVSGDDLNDLNGVSEAKRLNGAQRLNGASLRAVERERSEQHAWLT